MSLADEHAILSPELGPIQIANRRNGNLAYGLITLRAALPSMMDMPSHCEVQIANVRVKLPAKECIQADPTGFTLLVYVMTHLLPNGPVSANLTLEWENGSRVSFQSLEILIDNTTSLAASVRDDLKTHSTPIIFGGEVDSSIFPYATGATRPWFDTIEAQDIPLSFKPASSHTEAHRHLERWGFCILPDLLPSQMISSFRAELDDAISTGRLRYEAGSSQRIHDAHTLPSGRMIWLYPTVMRFLKDHFRDTPCACQTLTYVHGSEQSGHQDTIHLTPYPAGFMCGVWIALEDVAPDSGELFVYPGSHKTPRLRAAELGLEKVKTDYSSYVHFDRAINELISDGGYQRVPYMPQAGQILVWHENLIHGGSYRRDRTKTRLSIVSHYFAKGSVAYYDSRGEAATLELLPGLT
jgi:ectoine hydroxylase-related dioxygenase (phytanoyl-CoA dioxygenase family)